MTDHPFLRVERGQATDEELAAVMVVLLARSGAVADPAEQTPTVQAPRWLRLERSAAFCPPHSWQIAS
ncbi:acyl-CoA carboxylase subunit epsilon [Streptomyces sp. NPDC049099]|uniref:acyl-CoA carboxylase subunit epsilon n=1 Tax=unclassified Streptomyces TaxID=2593676 RepID=UPI0034336745